MVLRRDSSSDNTSPMFVRYDKPPQQQHQQSGAQNQPSFSAHDKGGPDDFISRLGLPLCKTMKAIKCRTKKYQYSPCQFQDLLLGMAIESIRYNISAQRECATALLEGAALVDRERGDYFVPTTIGIPRQPRSTTRTAVVHCALMESGQVLGFRHGRRTASVPPGSRRAYLRTALPWSLLGPLLSVSSAAWWGVWGVEMAEEWIKSLTLLRMVEIVLLVMGTGSVYKCWRRNFLYS